MKRLAVLAAALTWLMILCALATLAGHVIGGASTGAAIVPATGILALVAALAVGLTLAVALSPLPTVPGYIAAHLAGAIVVLAAMQWPHPPWAWQIAPGLARLFAHGLAGADSATLALLFGALTWELSYACTWLIVRDRRVWLALALIVGLVILTARPSADSSAVAALCAVGLAVVLAVAALERRERRPRLLRGSLALRAGPLLAVPVAAGLVAAAWAAPLPCSGAACGTPALPSSGSGWSTAFDRLLAAIGMQATNAHASPPALSSFGADLAIGGQFTPANTPVLIGRVAQPWRAPYWRGAVYDLYSGGTWRTLPARSITVPAGAPLPAPALAGAAAITQVVTLLRPSATLFTAGPPLSVGVLTDARVEAALAGAGTGIISLAPAGGTWSGTYSALSLSDARVGPPDARSGAPRLAPSVRAIDLALPPGLPARVGALARTLAGAGAADPYARALAIQHYLRGPDTATGAARYSYDTAPPQAPAGRDPVDYFLFDARRGFCTHFAAAMVVLARAAGIPARLITGYIAGRFDGAVFRVGAADAHAWPELWIAGRGWTAFEPTPTFAGPGQSGTPAATPSGAASTTASLTPAGGRSGATPPSGAGTQHSGTPGTRPTATAATSASPSATARGGASGTHGGGGWPGPAALGLLALAVLLGASTLGTAMAFIVLRAGADEAALYARLCGLARLLRAAPRLGQTPLEWASEIAARAPGDGAAVHDITNLYLRRRYGGQRATPEALAAARTAWRALRLRWLKRLLKGERL